MAKQTDVGEGRGTATPNLDPSHELQANTGTSTLGNTGSGLNTAGTFGQPQSQGDQGNPGVAQQAKEQAKNLAHEAKDQTVKVAEQARDHVQNLVSEQKDQAANRLGSLAGALREAGRKLNEGEQGGDFGRYADRAAEQMDRLSSYLRDNDLRGLVRDTESFARRRPEVFLGGALLAGLALARFLKASSPNQGFDGYARGSGGNWTGYPQSATGRQPYTGAYTGADRSSYTPERRNPDEAATANAGTTPYNAPLGV